MTSPTKRSSVLKPNNALDESPAATEQNQTTNSDGKPLPMHQKPMFKNPLLARQQKKATAGSGPVSSPTDNLMSPCTQKIQASRKHLIGTVQPKFLSEAFNDAKKQDASRKQDSENMTTNRGVFD